MTWAPRISCSVFSSLSFGNWGGPTNRFCSLKNFSPEGKSVALENNGEFLTDHVYGFFLASSKTHHRMRGRSEKIILTHATLEFQAFFWWWKKPKYPFSLSIFTFCALTVTYIWFWYCQKIWIFAPKICLSTKLPKRGYHEFRELWESPEKESLIRSRKRNWLNVAKATAIKNVEKNSNLLSGYYLLVHHRFFPEFYYSSPRVSWRVLTCLRWQLDLLENLGQQFHGSREILTWAELISCVHSAKGCAISSDFLHDEIFLKYHQFSCFLCFKMTGNFST